MKLAVIGTGKMGAAIFKLLSSHAFDITVLAISPEEAALHEKKYFRGIERSVRSGLLKEAVLRQQKEAIRFTHRMEDLRDADLVIEAIFEDKEAKVDLLRRLESVVRPETLLLSNTSSISIASLAEALKHRERFCGLHFFHPVLLINLVEIIRWSETPDSLLERLVGFCGQLGRTPIVVFDAPGSLINPILSLYYLEALYILEEGNVLPSRLDAIARGLFYVGPCESLDVIGFDFFLDAFRRVYSALRCFEMGREPFLFQKLPEANRLGKKTGVGIYRYEKDRPVDDALSFYRDPSGSSGSSDLDFSEDILRDRLLYAVFSGCLVFLRMGLADQEAIDTGVKEVLIMKRGPFSMIRSLGRDKVQETFDKLAELFGQRFCVQVPDIGSPAALAVKDRT